MRIDDSRSYLKSGPSAASVDNLELKEHRDDLTKEQALDAVDGLEGYQVK